MEYRIVSHDNAQDTEGEVNTLLEKGWSLHGDLKVTDTALVQAMVKHGDYEGSNDINVYLPNQDNFEDAIKSIGEALEEGLTNVAKALAYKE